MAAKVSGSKGFALIKRHFLSHLVKPLIVIATLDLGSIILEISGFSFLGLGVQAPTAEWGMMINEGKDYIRQHPSLLLYPGLAIIFIVVLINLLGESFRDGKRGSK